jgi:hypothetical protein
MVELSHIDIATEASHLVYSCEGHLEMTLHVMADLQQKPNIQLVFDPTYPKINMDSFPQFDWTQFYSDVEDAIPVDMPEPLGKDIDACMMCDSDHAGDKRHALVS